MLNLLCFGCSAVGQLVNGCFSLVALWHSGVYNRLRTYHSQDLQVYAPLRKKVLLSLFFFVLHRLICSHVNLACGPTGMGDAY